MILVNGDSWTGGPTYNNLEDTWPYQMAKKYNLNVTNLAWGGASNQRIFRTTIDYLYSTNEPPTHIILGWTTAERFEFPNKEGYYCRITIKGCSEFIETVKPVPNIESLRNIFYREMYNQELLLNSLVQNIFILQDLCSLKGIQLLNFNSFKEKPIFESIGKIDKTRWVIPPATSMMSYLENLNYGRTQSDHTTVEGQKHWADVIYSKIIGTPDRNRTCI